MTDSSSTDVPRHGDPPARAFSGSGTVLPVVPTPERLWRSLRFWIWVAMVGLVLAAIPDLLVDYWFFESIGKSSVWWTNFGTQLALFLITMVLFTLGDYIPIKTYAVSPTVISFGLHLGLWNGLFAGWLVSQNYLEFLQLANALPFGKVDPVFGKDLGFYVFELPAIRTLVGIFVALGADSAVAFLIGRFDQLYSTGTLRRTDLNFWQKLGLMITPGLNVAMTILGVSLVVETFLASYGLLFADNEESGVRFGASYLDVEGVFSTLNMIYLSTLIEIGIVVVMGTIIMRIAAHLAPILESEGGRPTAPLAVRPLLRYGAVFLSIDLLFFTGVIARQHIFVSPNEPNIQVPYIQRHIDATLSAYRLDGIKTVDWRPPEQPLGVADLAASKTVQNAPIWSPWVSQIEEPPDVQHLQRLALAESLVVYGPLLDVFSQEQQLRPYYQFISLDGVRYEIDGEKRMFVSAARELPSLAFVGPKEWLRYWGTAALMLTHGFGLVMAPVDQVNVEGGPVYVSQDIPPKVVHPELEHEPRIYFGEGMKDDYILTGVRHLRELDRATAQSRETNVYPDENTDGVRIDGVLKRLMFGIHTKDMTAFLFSEFIDHDKTRAHIYRTPLRRARRIAPWMFIDTNNYAFVSDKRVLWMLNGLTVTDQYPYSFREVLGDKADERAVEKYPERPINYAEDSVKVTVDAYSGDIHFYKIANDPIINVFDKIYPGLLEPKTAMPRSVEAQLTYPLQWFHVQFDDIYKRYHQKNPIEFYNVEDIWDDADEVLGSLGRGLSDFGTTDQMTFSYEGDQLLLDPADLPAGTGVGTPGKPEFALLMPFTPEGGRNLRSLVLAFQDPGTYGTLVNLRVPQGSFFYGPEQADTNIDTDSQVNQQITMWVRHGSEVIRGHTLVLPVKGDLLYVEPLLISSLQNPIPEIKLFSVCYRGRVTMGTTLADAIRAQGLSEAEEMKANELPWFEEAMAEGK